MVYRLSLTTPKGTEGCLPPFEVLGKGGEVEMEGVGEGSVEGGEANAWMVPQEKTCFADKADVRGLLQPPPRLWPLSDFSCRKKQK